MLLNLNNIYTILYSTRHNSKPLFHNNKWETIPFPISPDDEDDENDIMAQKAYEYFSHPSTSRWLLPALAGKIEINIDSQKEFIIFNRIDKKISIKNQKDFLYFHLQPLYKRIENELEVNHNLKDLMGRKDLQPFKGCGRTIRNILLDSLMDPQIIRQIVITQQTILEQYDYAPSIFRKYLIDYIDSTMYQDNNNPANIIDTTLIENGILPQLRTIILTLPSKGSDAAALTCLLLCAALRENASLILFHFFNNNQYDLLSLIEKTTPGQIDLGEGFYLTYDEINNYMGGKKKVNITLWKSPNIMVNKITDIFGYFFYPIYFEENLAVNFQNKYFNHKTNFSCNIFPFVNDYSIFVWEYQPDGDYFTDDCCFGRNDSQEIILYAYMDKKGRFSTNFSLNNPNKNIDI